MDFPPTLALIGFMGCGKSTVAQLVASRLGVPCYDLDALIEANAGQSIREIFERSEAEFRALEQELLPQALQPGVVALGGGTPLNDDSWELIRSRATTVWLDAPLEVLLDRAEPENRPLLHGLSKAAITSLFEKRRLRYQEADHKVDASKSPAEVAAEVVRLWPA